MPVTYRANRTLSGDYGHVQPGQTFTVPDHIAKKLVNLEAKGIVQRFYPRPVFDRKRYIVTENKMIEPAENKAAEPTVNRAVQPPLRKAR